MEIKTSLNINNIDKIKDAMREQLAVALEKIGMQAEAYAKLELEKPKEHSDGTVRPNVDTGRLVNSITHAVENETTVAIGTNVEYAAYVEMGTQKSLPYPYLEPAVTNHVDEYRQMVEETLKN